MRLCSQEHWSGCSLPSSENLPISGIEPASPAAPALETDSLPLSTTWEAQEKVVWGFTRLAVLVSWRRNIVRQTFLQYHTSTPTAVILLGQLSLYVNKQEGFLLFKLTWEDALFSSLWSLLNSRSCSYSFLHEDLGGTQTTVHFFLKAQIANQFRAAFNLLLLSFPFPRGRQWWVVSIMLKVSVPNIWPEKMKEKI